MVIISAEKEDLQKILDLQYLSYQSEARLLNNTDIPPLKQTLSEILAEYEKGIILKLLDGDNIIGSVRAYTENGTLYIGKLFIHPDFQGKGLGTRLLREIERICPHKRCELFTSSQSLRNLSLYQRVGYRIFKEKNISDNLKFIYLEK